VFLGVEGERLVGQLGALLGAPPEDRQLGLAVAAASVVAAAGRGAQQERNSKGGGE